MSDEILENNIDDIGLSLEDILAEFHAENDYADLEPEDTFVPEPAALDVTMDQVQEDTPVNPDGSMQHSERFPTASEIRAYLDSVKDRDFLNISEDISNPPADLEDIDRRFSVTGKPQEPSVVYAGEEIPVDPDEEYHPPVQEVELENDSVYAEPHNEFSRRRKIRSKPSIRRRRIDKRKKLLKEQESDSRIAESDSVNYEEFTSYSIPYSGIDADEYPFDDEHASAYDSDAKVVPSTFGGYINGLLASILYRIHRQRTREGILDPIEDEAELGKELKPLQASKYYGSFSQSLRLRFRISFLLWLIILWVSSGLPVFGYLKDIRIASAMCVLLQFTIMLLSLDIVTNAVMNVFTLRGGIDFIAVLSCVLTCLDGIMVVKSSSVSLHMPFCVISSLSLLGVLLSSLVSSRAFRKALRVPAIGKTIYAATAEPGRNGSKTVLKSLRPLDGFVRRTEETPLDEDIYIKFTPFILAACLFFTLLITAVKKSFSDTIFVFSVFIASAVPFTALLSFALPFFAGSMRIFSSGAAIAGWSGLNDIGQCRDIIVTDRDIFPKGSVEISSIRIFSDADSSKIISYAGSMMAPTGMASSESFIDMMRKNNGRKYKIENIEFLPAGGIKGIIEGERVLCGNVDFMRLMNVRVPYRLVDKNSVLLAIDGVLYGIFSIRYTPMKRVRKALTELISSNRHAIFAIRDFNITPEMLHSLFDIATDGYDFPPYLERFEISATKASGESRIAAVVCRESLGPLVDMADAGRSMYLAVRVNTLISLAGTAVGILFTLVSLFSAGSITPVTLLVLMLIFAVPVPLISFISLRRNTTKQ